MQWINNSCSCPSQGPYRRLFSAGDYNFQSTDATGDILRCESCGSVFPKIFPTPETLGEAYRRYYTMPKHQADKGPFRRLMNASRRDYLRRFLPANASRILDYGCGSGEFLVYLNKTGFQGEIWGTDIFKPNPLADTVNWIDMENLEDGPTYDWITLSHVLEHLDDPRRVLERLKRRLSPGGRIWMSTPNAESFLMATTKQWSRDVDFPRHREIYSRRGLEAYLSRMGLKAEFFSSPILNAAMAANSSLKNVTNDPGIKPIQLAAAAMKTFGMMMLLPVLPRLSTELVVVCSDADASADG